MLQLLSRREPVVGGRLRAGNDRAAHRRSLQVRAVRLGVDEAGAAIVATALAIDPTVGVTLALIRRLRILCWNAMGLSCWRVPVEAQLLRGPLASRLRRDVLERRFRRARDNRPIGLESRAVTRAVPRRLRLIPVDLASHMRADGGAEREHSPAASR